MILFFLLNLYFILFYSHIIFLAVSFLWSQFRLLNQLSLTGFLHCNLCGLAYFIDVIEFRFILSIYNAVWEGQAR